MGLGRQREILQFALVTKAGIDCALQFTAGMGWLPSSCPETSKMSQASTSKASAGVFIFVSSMGSDAGAGSSDFVSALLIRTWKIIFLFHELESSFLCFFLSFSFMPGMK